MIAEYKQFFKHLFSDESDLRIRRPSAHRPPASQETPYVAAGD
jgi:hypothetical protein